MCVYAAAGDGICVYMGGGGSIESRIEYDPVQGPGQNKNTVAVLPVL